MRALALLLYSVVMIGLGLLIKSWGWKFAAGILLGIGLIDAAHYVKYGRHVDF